MTTITNLARGASQDVTFTYTVKPEDAGKSISNTITAISGTAKASAVSAAVSVMEPVRSMEVNVTASNPKNGLAYVTNEVANFTATIRNTGNVDLTNVTFELDAGTYMTTPEIVESGYYTKTSSNIGSIGRIAPGDSINVSATSTPRNQSKNASTDNQAVSYSVGADNINKATYWSDRFNVSILVPQTQAEFSNLSWAQVNYLATDIVNGNSITREDTQHLVGMTKTLSITYPSSTTITYNVQLVSKYGSPLASGGNTAYTFMTVELVNAKSGTGSATDTSKPSSYGSSPTNTVCTNLYNGVYSTLKPYIKQVSIKTCSPSTLYGLTSSRVYDTSDVYLYQPSAIEINATGTYGAEGSAFSGRSSIDKIKSVARTTNAVTWSTRSRYYSTSTSKYMQYTITASGGYASQQASAQYNFPVCFCI